jgi:hypothetical protein
VTDDGSLVEFERVEDVLEQLLGAVTDLTAAKPVWVRESVAGKVEREHPPVGERGEQGRPHCGAEGHSVQQNQRSAGAM